MVRATFAILVFLGAALVLAQSPTPLPTGGKESPQPAKDKAALTPPPGSILILAEKAADTLRLLPKMVLLPPEKYQEMLDELNRLKESKTAKPQPPSSINIDGRLEPNWVKWSAKFRFVTDKPKQTVALGFTTAAALSASLDGETPQLKKTPNEGFLLQVENPGKHEALMEFASAITRNGEQHSVELELPGAAITQLTLALPKNSLAPLVTSKPGPDPLASFQDGILTIGAGPASKLEIQWRSQPKESQPRAMASESAILARVVGKEVQLRAEVRVIPLGGPMSVATLTIPPGASLRGATPADDAKIQAIEKTDSPLTGLRKIQLKEPVSDPLKLLIEKTYPLGADATVPIGPFYLNNAVRQTGTIVLANSGDAVRLIPLLRNEVLQQEINAADRVLSPEATASFRFWNPPWMEKPTALTGPGSLSLLDLQASLVSGLLEARADHQGKIVREESGIPQWRITTTLDCTPIRAGASQVEIQVPQGLRFDANRGPVPPALFRDIQFNPGTGRLTLSFAQDLLRSFQFSLEFTADLALDNLSAIPLPIPLQVRERGGQVTLSTPTDFELFASEKANPAFDTLALEPHKQAWSSDKYPQRVETQVRQSAQQPELQQMVDLHFDGAEVQVKHRIRYLFPGKVIPAAGIFLPPGLVTAPRVTKGGRVSPGGMENILEISFINPGQREHEVELEYSLEARGNKADLHFARPAAGTGEIQARIWGDLGMEFTALSSQWRLSAVDDLTGFDRFPNAVFKSKTALVLPLQWVKNSLGREKGSRALARALVGPSATQYHVSYSLIPTGNHADFQLPLGARNFRPLYDNKDLNWTFLEGTTRTARVTLPRPLTKPVVLEFSLNRSSSPFSQSLAIPAPEGEQCQVKWLLRYSPKEALLGPSPSSQDFHWVRDGLFFGRAAVVNEPLLDNWLLQGVEEAMPQQAESHLGEVVLVSDSRSSLEIALVSRGLLQVILSGAVLAVAFWVKSRGRVFSWITRQIGWLSMGSLLACGILVTLKPWLAAALFLGLQPALGVMILFTIAMMVDRTLAWIRARRYSSFSQTVADSVSTSRVARRDSKAPGLAGTTGYWMPQDGSSPNKPVAVTRSTSTHPPDFLPD